MHWNGLSGSCDCSSRLTSVLAGQHFCVHSKQAQSQDQIVSTPPRACLQSAMATLPASMQVQNGQCRLLPVHLLVVGMMGIPVFCALVGIILVGNKVHGCWGTQIRYECGGGGSKGYS